MNMNGFEQPVTAENCWILNSPAAKLITLISESDQKIDSLITAQCAALGLNPADFSADEMLELWSDWLK